MEHTVPALKYKQTESVIFNIFELPAGLSLFPSFSFGHVTCWSRTCPDDLFAQLGVHTYPSRVVNRY